MSMASVFLLLFSLSLSSSTPVVPEMKDMMVPEMKDMMVPEMKDVMVPEMKDMMVPEMKDMMVPEMKDVMVPEMKDIQQNNGRFHFLAQFLTPESCVKCADDIEDILHLCYPGFLSLIDPECMGAIVYATQDCPLCLCQIVENQLPEEEKPLLCPYCPKLPECPLNFPVMP